MFIYYIAEQKDEPSIFEILQCSVPILILFKQQIPFHVWGIGLQIRKEKENLGEQCIQEV